MKKKNGIRTASLLLAALICIGTLISCGDGEDTPADTGENAATAAQTEPETGYGALEKRKYNREFTILTRSDENAVSEFMVEKRTGAVLDDAVFERNVVVSEDYGITLNVLVNGDYSVVNSTLTTQVSTGLDEYDLYVGHKSSFSSCLQNNQLYDLGAIDTLDLLNPWWDKGCRENMTVYGHTFMINGDVNTNSLRTSSCFVFNKKLFTETGRAYPYEAVDNGKWTLDHMIALTEGFTADKDGDGKISYKTDEYAMTAWMMATPYSLFYGAGGRFVTMDEDGTPVLNYDSERVTDLYDKIYKLLITNQAYYVTDPSLYDSVYEVFTTGRALFCDTSLVKIGVYLIEMGEDYGILPDPKFDESQKEYYSFVNGATTLDMVARSESNPEFVGAVLEAMGAYNYAHVTPTLYEAVTKLKNARDPESARMVDVIIRNRVFDFGYYADLSLTNVVKDQIGKKSATIASALKTADKNSRGALDKIVKKMAQYDGE